MSKRSRRYLIFILVFVLFFDSILIGMYLMIHAKGDKAENKNRMGMGQVKQRRRQQQDKLPVFERIWSYVYRCCHCTYVFIA